MLTRLYVDNFRALVNFDFRPSRKQLIFGNNGTGKSSLLDAVLFVRQFVVNGVNAFSLQHERTRWQKQPQQTFEIEALLDGGSYIYHLSIEPEEDSLPLRVLSETVHFNGKPIFEFLKGEVNLYNDEFEHKVAYEFDWQRSALATIIPRGDNQTLSRFKTWLSGLYCFRIDPFTMGSLADTENLYPKVNLSNVAAWYRHLVQAHPKQNAALLDSLRAAIEDFSFLQLEPMGEKVRVLVAEFTQRGGGNMKFGFNQLSDGQRCLICLYTVLHFVLAAGGTVILDEPDNFVSLPEIQPWLMAVADVVDGGTGQVLVVSHHPEFINQWAPAGGVQLVRDGVAPVRIEEFRPDPDSLLPAAELVARGWTRA